MIGKRVVAILLTLATGCVAEAADELGVATAAATAAEADATVAAGRFHSCKLDDDGSVACWGRNNYGQLGVGAIGGETPSPLRVLDIDTAVGVVAGDYHTCALLADGTVRCWGLNSAGQLGDGTTATRSLPVAVSGISTAANLGTGSYHTCATLEDGKVSCWGHNTYGQLGNGTTVKSSVPVAVGGTITIFGKSFFWPLIGAEEVDGGRYSTCARMATGAVQCWGRNQQGQLGVGDTSQRTTPTPVSGIDSAISLSVGMYHACAGTSADNRTWCWGWNAYGQLGDATTTRRTTPVPVKDMPFPGILMPIAATTTLAAGGYHSCFVGAYNRVACAGRNDYGQSGHDPGEPADKYAAATSLYGVDLDAGTLHTCVRTPADDIVCFGSDAFGQLGPNQLCPEVPTLAIGTVAGADVFERFDDHNRIVYASGTHVTATLRTSECARVSAVTFGGVPVGTAADPDGGTRWYEVMSQTVNGDGTKDIAVRLHFANRGNGASFRVAFEVESPSGEVAGDELVLATVRGINETRGRVHLPAAELNNIILGAIFDKFGDSNRFERSGRDVYDFEYENLDLSFDESGIGLFFAAHADLVEGTVDEGGLCDPRISGYAKFKLVVADGGIGVDWVVHPDTDVDTPILCDAVALLGLVSALLDDIVIDGIVERQLEKRIARLGGSCPGGDCSAIASIIHFDGGIEIELAQPLTTVTIDVPYDSDAIDDPDAAADPMLRGIAIPTDEPHAVVAGGLAEACIGGGGSGPCELRTIGAGGLFNWSGETVIPTPWPSCEYPPCPYYEGRHQAWLAQQGLGRYPEQLPMPSFEVGAVVARAFVRTGESYASEPVRYAGTPCDVPETGGDEARLAFGRNEHPRADGNPNGTGDAEVTLVFLGVPALGDDVPDCKTE